MTVILMMIGVALRYWVERRGWRWGGGVSDMF